MNHSVYTGICDYFVNTAKTQIDVTNFSPEYLETPEFASIRFFVHQNYSPNYMKVFNTITGFHLTEAECKELMHSSRTRYEDEEYDNYKKRLTTKTQFERHGKKLFKFAGSMGGTE